MAMVFFNKVFLKNRTAGRHHVCNISLFTTHSTGVQEPAFPNIPPLSLDFNGIIAEYAISFP